MHSTSAELRPVAATGTGGIPVIAGRFVFGVAALVLFALTAFWSELGKPFGPGTSGALAVLLFAFHVALVRRRLSPFDPLVWVPVGILLFYFGTPFVLELMDVPAPKGYDPWGGGNATYVDRGYCAALFSLASLLWGIHLCGIRSLPGRLPGDRELDRSLAPTALLFAIGGLGMVSFGIALVGPGTVFGLYGDWWDAKRLGADQRWIDIGVIFTYSAVFALLSTDEPTARWRRWFAYGVALVVAVITIQKGDRSGLIALGMGAGWCYSQRIARVAWTPVIAAAAVALLLMPVLVEWRAERSLEASRRSSAYELAGKSLYAMGSSVNAIVFTVEFVPKYQGFTYGSSFKHTLLTALPNVAFTKGKSFVKPKLEDLPANWISSILAPGWYAAGGGYGFAMAAEWYYNFGFPGVWLGMALVGWLLARTRNASLRSSFALFASACFFAGVAVWVRNVSGHPFKAAVWPVIGLFVIDLLVRMLRGRSSQPPAPVPATLHG